MKRVLLRVSYDGTAYHGWQLQPGQETIEGVLNDALETLTHEKIKVTGASRTDAGVHARGNVAVFDTSSPIPGERFAPALNSILPPDVVIQESKEVGGSFHPRHTDCKKTYEYRILNRSFPIPEYRNMVFFQRGKLDAGKMKEATEAFVGTHDFTAFCAANTPVEDKVRTIYELDVICRDDDMIIIRVTGNGFLYNMVRIIAGTLVAVGRGRIKPEEISDIIESRDRKKAGETAPPQGLTLVSIEYDSSCSA